MDEEKKIQEFFTEYKFWIKMGAILLVAVGIFFGGFFMGRAEANKHHEPVIITKYEKGDEIKVEVEKPVPYEVIKPVDTMNFLLALIASGLYDEVFPDRPKDTVYITPSKEDTSAVVADYSLKRIYNETFFDNDTLGKFEFHGEVQFNRLRYYGYSYSPVYKTVTETKYIIRKFSPYIGGGLSTRPAAIVQAGMFFDEKYGVGIQYNYDWQLKKNDFGALFIYKF